MNDPLWFPWQKVGNQNWSYFSSTFFTDNINFLLEFSHFLQTLFYNPTNVTGIHRVLSSVLLSSNRKKYKKRIVAFNCEILEENSNFFFSRFKFYDYPFNSRLCYTTFYFYPEEHYVDFKSCTKIFLTFPKER